MKMPVLKQKICSLLHMLNQLKRKFSSGKGREIPCFNGRVLWLMWMMPDHRVKLNQRLLWVKMYIPVYKNCCPSPTESWSHSWCIQEVVTSYGTIFSRQSPADLKCIHNSSWDPYIFIMWWKFEGIPDALKENLVWGFYWSAITYFSSSTLQRSLDRCYYFWVFPMYSWYTLLRRLYHSAIGGWRLMFFKFETWVQLHHTLEVWVCSWCEGYIMSGKLLSRQSQANLIYFSGSWDQWSVMIKRKVGCVPEWMKMMSSRWNHSAVENLPLGCHGPTSYAYPVLLVSLASS